MKTRSKTLARIPITAPRTICLVEEGGAIINVLDVLDSLMDGLENSDSHFKSLAVEQAHNLLARVRLRQQIALRDLQSFRKSGMALDVLHYDSVLEQLPVTSKALCPFGRFRGYTAVLLSVAVAHAGGTDFAATSLDARRQLKCINALQLSQLNELFDSEIDRWQQRNNRALPNGNRDYEAAPEPGGTSYLVITSQATASE